MQAGTLRALLWMFLSTIGLSISHLIVRAVSPEIHSFQTVFFRGFFGLIVISPWIFRHGLGLFKTDNLKLHLVRAAFSFSSISCFYYALTIIPLAKATAIGFVAPILGSVLAVVLLKEASRTVHWIALVMGLVGMLFVLRPGFAELDTGTLFMLASAGFFSVNLVVIKVLARSDSAIAITAFISAMVVPLSLPMAIPVWVWPDPWEMILLTIMGLLNGASLIAFTQAMKEAATPIIMPLDFLRLIWMAAFGYLFFAEIPDSFTLIGGVIIFVGASMVAIAERSKQPIART